MTLTTIAERLAVELCLFYDLGMLRLPVGFEQPTFRLRGQRSNQLRHRRGLITVDWTVKLRTNNTMLCKR